MKDRDLLDLVRDFSPLGVPAGQFVSILRKMPARLYSIASSLKSNPDEVHLTIRSVRYDAHGRDRYGVCSVQCAERLQPGDTLPVYIHENPNFKLPPAPDIPIIMIGPGTGVAPFRAFLQEREEIAAEGKTWLFFGDQHFRTDFLYQVDWQKWLKKGVLTRMDVAFSRDTDKKVYVQHRMLEKSRELFQWLEEGAYVYVCGDEKHMAHDVHAALAAILEREGGMNPDQATAYLAGMQQQRRYQRDVY
jgi:sulfite reductase (NADPH) flavoprotein alpha-component